jgi:hypothetical protein
MSRQGAIRTRATELTIILYVTKEEIYARWAVFTVIREQKSDSMLNKGADTRAHDAAGKGRRRRPPKGEYPERHQQHGDHGK